MYLVCNAGYLQLKFRNIAYCLFFSCSHNQYICFSDMLTQKRCVGERVFVSGYVSLYLWVCVCLRVCV